MDRLLIIGSSGLVGSRLASLASKHGFEAYNTTRSRKSSMRQSLQLDITDRDATLRLVRDIQPSAIINTAAVTNVDYCETHPEEARMVNVEGARNLADAIPSKKVRLVQISTDYVFDGTRGQYVETDTPNPLSQYAKTKLEAEKIVSSLPSFAIARPSVIYGWNPPEAPTTGSVSGKPMNFAMFVLDGLRKNQTIKAVRDQYSTPTFADNLAEALLRLTRHQKNGVYHTAGRSCLSRYEFAMKLAAVFGYSTNLIQPISASDFQQLAPRPKNSCLCVANAEKVLDTKFMTVDEGIREMKKQASVVV